MSSIFLVCLEFFLIKTNMKFKVHDRDAGEMFEL